MKKFWVFAVILICLAVAGFGTWKFLETQVLSSEKLVANVTINGIDCSNMTLAQAQEKLTDTWNKKTLSIQRDGKQVAAFSDFGFSYAIDRSLSNLKRDHIGSAILNHLFGTTLDATIPMDVSDTGSTLEKSVQNTAVFKTEKPVVTRDARVDLSKNQVRIIPEVYGTNTDYDTLISDMVKAVESDETTMSYEPATYYTKPKLTSESPEIQERFEFCNTYLKGKFTYKMGKENVPIPVAEIDKMIKVTPSKKEGEDPTITVKKSAVRKYVEKFSVRYSTVGATRKFTAYSGNRVTVSGGDYGYAVDTSKETRQLIKDLKKSEKITRAPKWSQKGWGAYNRNNDLGSTYVEISIGSQHLWYYKNGKRIVDCSVVTGNTVSGTITPTGVYGLSYKQRGATLKGYNTDGTTYESPVSYWMPFYGNYGMHDAPWRGSFGGSIYRGSGSHGCVNMPPASAAVLFNNLADSGTPIVVHW